MYSKIHVHAIWGTQNHNQVLTAAIRKLMLPQINLLANNANITLNAVCIQPEHIHCLITLPLVLSISDCLLELRKGLSTWANSTMAINPPLVWDDCYYAVSVSESQCDAVKKYIDNQPELHKTKSFEQECEEMNLRFGF